MRHLIVVKPGGVVRTIYTDALPLHQLGTLKVTRASNVEYDNDQQGWTVTLADGRILPGCWRSRADALKAEVDAVNAEL